MGHSGSGKSTIASLLLRFYDINFGSVAIDGIDIRKYSMEKLRNQISIVQQEPLLFNESIKENILFGDEKATTRMINHAASQANSMAFIMQSNEDLKSPIVQEAVKTQFHEMLRRIQGKIYTCKAFM